MKLTLFAAPLLLATGIAATPASAEDRQPTAEERSKIEAALKTEGFVSWSDIELDDDRVWEVDDARHSDGKEYDVDLDPQTFAIVKRDED